MNTFKLSGILAATLLLSGMVMATNTSQITVDNTPLDSVQQQVAKIENKNNTDEQKQGIQQPEVKTNNNGEQQSKLDTKNEDLKITIGNNNNVNEKKDTTIEQVNFFSKTYASIKNHVSTHRTGYKRGAVTLSVLFAVLAVILHPSISQTTMTNGISMTSKICPVKWALPYLGSFFGMCGRGIATGAKTGYTGVVSYPKTSIGTTVGSALGFGLWHYKNTISDYEPVQ
jgi:hypothetical protein